MKSVKIRQTTNHTQEVTVQKLSANAGRPVEVDSRKAEIGAESRWPFLAACVFHGRESNEIPDQWAMAVGCARVDPP